MEIWKDVPGYSGMYQVSNTGKIKSLSRFKRGRGKSMFITPERILSGIRNKYGYLEVILHDGSTIKHHTIHRLVAMAFVPNPDNLPQINHKNEIKTDNRVENLEWCTAKYNMNFGTRTQRMKKSRSFPVMQIDKSGVVVSVYDGIREAERQTGIKRPNICKCLKGKIKTAGGYKWEYSI